MWIVEVQIIPAKMCALKAAEGHAGYSNHRFHLECCRRTRMSVVGEDGERRTYIKFDKDAASQEASTRALYVQMAGADSGNHAGGGTEL